MNPTTHKLLPFSEPDWPIPDTVRAITTHRGHFQPGNPYSCFNLGLHVHDDPQQVIQHRQALTQALHFTQEPYWLDQVHGTSIATLTNEQASITADGSITQEPHQACVILTADCLPVLITNTSGTEVAAIHAGWRGLLAGILDQAIKQCHSPTEELLVWLGPCIGPKAFELNDTIRKQFINTHASWGDGFHQNTTDHWFADLQQLAYTRLTQLGIRYIHADTRCTFEHKNTFYSYRRDGQTTGRMAHLIWLVEPDGSR